MSHEKGTASECLPIALMHNKIRPITDLELRYPYEVICAGGRSLIPTPVLLAQRNKSHIQRIPRLTINFQP